MERKQVTAVFPLLRGVCFWFTTDNNNKKHAHTRKNKHLKINRRPIKKIFIKVCKSNSLKEQIKHNLLYIPKLFITIITIIIIIVIGPQ